MNAARDALYETIRAYKREYGDYWAKMLRRHIKQMAPGIRTIR